MRAGPGAAVGERVGPGTDELAAALGPGVTTRLAVVPAAPCPEIAVVQAPNDADAANSTNTQRARTARV